TDGLAFVQNPRPTALDRDGAPAVVRPESVYRSPATAGQHPFYDRIAAVDDESSRPGHDSHEMMELRLDRSKILEDVGMIELDIVQNCDGRSVVHHLGALVEESGVVLVGFAHEEIPLAQPRGHIEVQRYTADEKAGGEPGVLEDPGE